MSINLNGWLNNAMFYDRLNPIRKFIEGTPRFILTHVSKRGARFILFFVQSNKFSHGQIGIMDQQ